MTQIFLLAGTSSFPDPGNWDPVNNKVEVVGTGGQGTRVTLGGPPSEQSPIGGGPGGGGGAYAWDTSLPGPFPVVIQIYAGGETASLRNRWGPDSTTSSWTRGQSIVAECAYYGSNGGGGGGFGRVLFPQGSQGGVGASWTSGNDGMGGGGAGGPHGVGGNGAGTVGGTGDGGTTPAGANGTQWDASHGIGGGGPGGVGSGTLGGVGGQYGAGAGGSNMGGGTGARVAGGAGIIVITYTPLVPGGQVQMMG